MSRVLKTRLCAQSQQAAACLPVSVALTRPHLPVLFPESVPLDAGASPRKERTAEGEYRQEGTTQIAVHLAVGKDQAGTEGLK